VVVVPIDKKNPEDSQGNDSVFIIKKLRRFISRIITAVIIIIIVWSSFFVISPGEKGIVFNSFSGLKETIYGEGLHFKIPLIEHVIRMNIRTQKQEEEAQAASSDLQDVSTRVAVNFVVDKAQLIEIYRTIGQATGAEDYMQTEIMNPIIQESVKSVTAHYSAEQLISRRPQVKKELDDLIKQRMEKYNIRVLDVSITNFQFSEEFTRAIESKVTAEQNALKEQNNLQVIKFQAQQKIEQSKGEAEAIRIVNEELLKSPKYIDYLTIQKWDGKMPLSLGSGSLLSITGSP